MYTLDHEIGNLVYFDTLADEYALPISLGALVMLSTIE